MKKLDSVIFENKFTSVFPGDLSENSISRQTPGVLFSRAVPTPVTSPSLLAWNSELAAELKLKNPDENDLQILAGNSISDSMVPYASCYGGHQFGNWAGQLGDGRAINLGEISAGEKKWEFQLKGAGPTAYSRGADGRAVLRSSVREYLISEAMHNLGIPTTRALSLVKTGEEVVRDMFYNGNPRPEPGAIICRLSPSFLRFGSFEILTARNEPENLKNLVNYTIDKYFPHPQGEDKILLWFREIMESTAVLIVEWLRVGFVHGVMNTDNMSVLGLTLDYGPFSFLDQYDHNFTPNTTDLPGRRYAFGKQASVASWNLTRMASAILPLVKTSEDLEKILADYEKMFWTKYYRMKAQKLGLDEVREKDKNLINNFEKVISEVQPDMTIFYRLLCDFPEDMNDETEIINFFSESFYDEPGEELKKEFLELLRDYSGRMKKNKIERKTSREIMKKANPKFILRNYLLFEAIEELEDGKDELFRNLEEALKDPYSEKFPEFFTKRPEWANEKAGCSTLSCSS